MALINCPECGKQISDKAQMCPHCGFSRPVESYVEIELTSKNARELGWATQDGREGTIFPGDKSTKVPLYANTLFAFVGIIYVGMFKGEEAYSQKKLFTFPGQHHVSVSVYKTGMVISEKK